MRKTNLSALLCALLCMALLTAPALAVVQAPENTYVGDYAGVLSDATEDYIMTQNETLTAATGGAIVVVTVDFLDGMEIDDYAYEIFNDWGIGDADADNGCSFCWPSGRKTTMPCRAAASRMPSPRPNWTIISGTTWRATLPRGTMMPGYGRSLTRSTTGTTVITAA